MTQHSDSDMDDLERLRRFERELLQTVDEERFSDLWRSIDKASPAKIFEALALHYLEHEEALKLVGDICAEQGFLTSQCPSDAVRKMANRYEEACEAEKFVAESLSTEASIRQGYASGVRWWCMREDRRAEYLRVAQTTVAEWAERQERWRREADAIDSG